MQRRKLLGWHAVAADMGSILLWLIVWLMLLPFLLNGSASAPRVPETLDPNAPTPLEKKMEAQGTPLPPAALDATSPRIEKRARARPPTNGGEE